MKLRYLRFFTAVVENGGVVKAAERLHVSQPAVSAGIKALEEELGGPLFDRGNGRRLNLTLAGRGFYRQAQEILERCASAKSDFTGGTQQQRVRIGVLDTLPEGLLLGLLERLAERRPAWQVELWEGVVARLSEWLGQGRIELALTHVRPNTVGERVLWEEPLVAVVPPNHPFAALAGIGLDQLAAEPFLHRSRCELDAFGRAQLRAAGISLRVVMRAERDDLVFERIRRGQGITLAPRSLVPADLTSVPVNGLAVSRAIGLQWVGEGERDWIETVAEELRELQGIDAPFSVEKSRESLGD